MLEGYGFCPVFVEAMAQLAGKTHAPAQAPSAAPTQAPSAPAQAPSAQAPASALPLPYAQFVRELLQKEHGYDPLFVQLMFQTDSEPHLRVLAQIVQSAQMEGLSGLELLTRY